MAYRDAAVIADWENKWLDPDYDFYGHHCVDDEIDNDDNEIDEDEYEDEEYDNAFDYSDNDADDARLERMGFNF